MVQLSCSFSQPHDTISPVNRRLVDIELGTTSHLETVVICNVNRWSHDGWKLVVIKSCLVHGIYQIVFASIYFVHFLDFVRAFRIHRTSSNYASFPNILSNISFKDIFHTGFRYYCDVDFALRWMDVLTTNAQILMSWILRFNFVKLKQRFFKWHSPS